MWAFLAADRVDKQQQYASQRQWVEKVAREQQRRRVLILGASGKVGRLVRAVWAADATSALCPVPVVRTDMGLPGQVIWSPGDAMESLPSTDAVIALWGVISSPGADLAENTALALVAMEIGRAVGADRVLHCSSATVYAPGPDPLSEDMPPDPPSPYGRAKLDMERAIAKDRRSEDPVATCLRIGSVAGAESLFGAMIGADDVHLDRFPDGNGPERSYIAPLDLAHVLERLAAVPVASLPAVVNVGAPVSTPMEMIARAAGRQVIWREAPAGATQRLVLDTTRLSAICPLPAEMAEPDHLVSDWLRWKAPE